MTPADLSRTVVRAVRGAVEDGELRVPVPERVVVERTRPGGVGEYACNVALRLAREAGRPPREVAALLAGRLAGTPGIAAVEITGPGFLNFSLASQTGLLAAVSAQGIRYGHGDALAGQVYSFPSPSPSPSPSPFQFPFPFPSGPEAGPTAPVAPTTSAASAAPLDPAGPRGVVVRGAVARLLQAQGALVHTQGASVVDRDPTPTPDNALDSSPDPTPAPTPDSSPDPTPDNAPDDAPTPLSLAIAPAARRDDDAFARVGVADVVWLMLATPLKETPKLPAGPLAQDESNPCFLVRYAHSRARAAVRDAARLGYTPDRAPDRVHDDPSLDPVHDRGAPAPALLAALAEYPLVLEAAAHHRAPERLARHLVTVADALVDCSYDVLPKGDEKPSAAHRSRLALVEAAGTVLAGGLSLLGIDAPDTL